MAPLRAAKLCGKGERLIGASKRKPPLLPRNSVNRWLTGAAQPFASAPRLPEKAMSTVMTQSYRRQRDHFEPNDADPQEQRRLRGLLEQIDYAAFIANREVIAQSLGKADLAMFQKLAVTTAQARARWTAEALRLAHSGSPATPDQTARLAACRSAYEELAEAYEGLRRMVERGYLTLTAP
jgi:hypothetical protein